LRSIVIAMHADPGFDRAGGAWPAHASFVAALASHAREYSGSVYLIHGDHHTYRVDQPFARRSREAEAANVTRMETFGSPDIGWVRVVVDTLAGRVLAFEPRNMSRRFPW
jgi:hypothetical protein